MSKRKNVEHGTSQNEIPAESLIVETPDGAEKAPRKPRVRTDMAVAASTLNTASKQKVVAEERIKNLRAKLTEAEGLLTQANADCKAALEFFRLAVETGTK